MSLWPYFSFTDVYFKKYAELHSVRLSVQYTNTNCHQSKLETERGKGLVKLTAVYIFTSGHCATNRKVAGSIPDDVIGIFH